MLQYFWLGIVSAIVIIIMIALVAIAIVLLVRVSRHHENILCLNERVTKEGDEVLRQINNTNTQLTSYVDSRIDKAINKKE